jgi:rubrerythrin
MAYNRFAKGSGVYTCAVCGKRTRRTGDGAGVGLCEKCYEYATWENSHSDHNHDEKPDPNCPVCMELNLVPKKDWF